MFIIIITGGIGSGKSFIIKYIEKFGYKIFQTDVAAEHVMQSDVFLEAVKKHLKTTEHLDLETIKQKIILGKLSLEFVESIVHPEVQKIRSEWINENLSNSSFIFVEVPLFFEKNLKDMFLQHSKVIVVSALCSVHKRICRVKKRDHKLPNDILNTIIAKQCDDNERVAGSDVIIYTFGSKHNVKKQVNKLLRLLKS